LAGLHSAGLHQGKQFLDDIAATLGGYVAEEMKFDDVTTGPSNDLAVITGLARDMVVRYGMSEALGPVAFGERTLGACTSTLAILVLAMHHNVTDVEGVGVWKMLCAITADFARETPRIVKRLHRKMLEEIIGGVANLLCRRFGKEAGQAANQPPTA
jgi:hypothetical protein